MQQVVSAEQVRTNLIEPIILYLLTHGIHWEYNSDIVKIDKDVKFSDFLQQNSLRTAEWLRENQNDARAYLYETPDDEYFNIDFRIELINTIGLAIVYSVRDDELNDITSKYISPFLKTVFPPLNA